MAPKLNGRLEPEELAEIYTGENCPLCLPAGPKVSYVWFSGGRVVSSGFQQDCQK